MLEERHLDDGFFDHLTAPWIKKSWHNRIQRVPAPVECRIWARKWPVGGDCCLWLGANDGKKNGRVHGKVKIEKRRIYLHRYAFACHHGISIDLLDNVDHICRNSTCFNPYHLEDVTPKENTDRGDGVLYQFKPPEQYGESTITEDDIAALASGGFGGYRR